MPAPPDQLHPRHGSHRASDIRARVETLERYTLADVVEANERRTELGLLMRRFHQRYDLLVTPISSKPVPHVGTAPATPFAFPFDITQQPAASAPVGFDSNGLPVGLQIVGLQYGDAVLLRASRALERAHPFPLPHLDSLGPLTK